MFPQPRKKRGSQAMSSKLNLLSKHPLQSLRLAVSSRQSNREPLHLKPQNLKQCLRRETSGLKLQRKCYKTSTDSECRFYNNYLKKWISRYNFNYNLNYVYFQDFLPDNQYDFRIVIIGRRAFAIKRITREGDFRASGSGIIHYSKENIPINLISLSFETQKKIQSQSLALDFLYGKDASFSLVEVSYAFSSAGYLSCPGYWDENLTFHQTEITPEFFMIEDFLQYLEYNW